MGTCPTTPGTLAVFRVAIGRGVRQPKAGGIDLVSKGAVFGDNAGAGYRTNLVPPNT
ncbi:hypothetical protein [Microvirga sp. VF16]|uniref:hypothetical protein n=1 Tax=Microvirga sp. VF16 TaxID=2807101 RepID=UPI00193DCC66|nr:hypothetical protein [Microvirga sp. VF16]QRM34064.1 hypothetical protein JO965_32875 [Microvirga sp. VF16]